jgi:hypothetical protein
MKNLALLSLIGILDCSNLASQTRIGDYSDDMRSSLKTCRLSNDPRLSLMGRFQNGTNNNIPCMPVHYLYHYNGKLSEMGTWMSGKWIGKYKSYYENGTIKTELNYDHEGKRDGVQHFYHKTGELFKKCVYSHGKEVSFLIVTSKPKAVSSPSGETFKFQKRTAPVK